jgi:hypothetical protein
VSLTAHMRCARGLSAILNGAEQTAADAIVRARASDNARVSRSDEWHSRRDCAFQRMLMRCKPLNGSLSAEGSVERIPGQAGPGRPPVAWL